MDDDRHQVSLDDLRVIFGHLGGGLEDVGERQDKKRENQMEKILWKDEGAARRNQDRLPRNDTGDDRARENADDGCGQSGNAGAAKPDRRIDPEDLTGEARPGRTPRPDDT